MRWTSLNPEEPKTSYTSKATDVKDVTEDIKIVVDKMIENREVDEATDAKQLFFFINATNGYMQITWCDFANDKFLGKWGYWLQLNDFWEKLDDAFKFDDQCFRAIANFTEFYMISNEGIELYQVFYRTELGGGAEQIDI